MPEQKPFLSTETRNEKATRLERQAQKARTDAQRHQYFSAGKAKKRRADARRLDNEARDLRQKASSKHKRGENQK